MLSYSVNIFYKGFSLFFFKDRATTHMFLRQHNFGKIIDLLNWPFCGSCWRKLFKFTLKKPFYWLLIIVFCTFQMSWTLSPTCSSLHNRRSVEDSYVFFHLFFLNPITVSFWIWVFVKYLFYFMLDNKAVFNEY